MVSELSPLLASKLESRFSEFDEYTNDKRPLTTSDPKEAVKIRLGESGIDSTTPLTIPQVFLDTVAKYGKNTALVSAEKKVYTYNEYFKLCCDAAKSFIHLGLGAHECVSIIGFNAAPWNITAMGSVLAGGMSAGIYTTNGPDSCSYIVNHSESRVVVCEGKMQLDKFILLSQQNKISSVNALIVWDMSESDVGAIDCDIPIYSWESFLTLGEKNDVTEDMLESRMLASEPGHVASLIYTSGTTGPPKAVMISHDNITWTSSLVGEVLSCGPEDRMVSYLPLSHIAAQTLDIHGAVRYGYAVYFARPDALKGTITQTLTYARPTIFFGVPRVWEKIKEKMQAIGKKVKGPLKKISTWAKSKGTQKMLHDQTGSSHPSPSCFGCANKIVFSKIKKKLGLDATRVCVSAAAPIAKEVIEYFGSIDIQIFELFGQSECTGPCTAQYPGLWKVGTVGPKIPGTILKLAPGNDEIIYTGRHIFMGYMKMQDKTDDAVDKDGYLHSGDVGSIDSDGFLKITGRIKELIITAGGENIAPVLIEAELKKAMPALSNAVVIGDKRKFLSVLLSLKTAVDTETAEPLNTLAGDAISTAEEIGSTATTVEEAATCPKFAEYFNNGLKTANSNAISRAQYVQKWTLMPVDFSVPGGELTPTLKVKRPIVNKKYADLIENFYN